MTTTRESRFLTEFGRFEMDRARASWLAPIRKAAMARFAETGFPTVRDEEWRFTNIEPIATTPFKLADKGLFAVTRPALDPYLFADNGTTPIQLVFVNGTFAPQLSSLHGLPAGVRAGSLAIAAAENPDAIQQHLTRYAASTRSPFTALNTAFLDDGAYVFVPRGLVLEQPIHVLHVSTCGGESTVSHPRNLFVMEDSSQALIVEDYVGLGIGAYFTNAVTEIVAGENVVLDHCKVQREFEGAYHVANLVLHQSRSSNVTSHSIALGAAIARNDINAILNGEGCDCHLNGLFMVGGRQHVDHHLRVDHAKPHCDSRETYRGILDGQAHGVFTGRIVVHKDAQKTDAKQTNKNLLLSEEAQIDTVPQLEIFADDVKCTHGATIGQIDADAIFYLRSRGIDEAAARGMLIHAFAGEIIDQVKVRPMRAQLEELLLARLPQGQLLKEAV